MLTIGEPMLRKMGANSRQLAIEKFDVSIVIKKYDQAIYRTLKIGNAMQVGYETIATNII